MMLDKYTGCLLGVAIGDALGAPVEGMTLEEIKRKYGADGITDFDSYRGPEAGFYFEAGFYTDDTQMTVATARGILDAAQGGLEEGPDRNDDVKAVYLRYLEWLKSQYDPRYRRGPGMSCLTSLQSGIMGTVEHPINNSKGCGGVMRTAPAGLAFKAEKAFAKGSKYAAITHGHPSGYLSAGYLSSLITLIINGKPIDNAIEISEQILAGHEGHEETSGCVLKARRLALSDKPHEEAIKEIGQGWVGEEALGIALYCSLKFADWREGTLAAVNHDGDSDSTGSITGGIMGALLGSKSIPGKWVKTVEGSTAICEIAGEIHARFAGK
ncbi:MAG: ADP-ribosylglycohydrolase family protein [Candidatus Desulfatibia sp.]|uniref:ADP-ribosylglycohydrolase family protein n=1 Tax=Candidatus Desulfatibia sp. TaxID=3101189 RepID=UPI002F2E3246